MRTETAQLPVLWNRNKEKAYAPESTAPTEVITAWVALRALALACHVAGADPGDDFEILFDRYRTLKEAHGC
jgi:hypothetical protein